MKKNKKRVDEMMIETDRRRTRMRTHLRYLGYHVRMLHEAEQFLLAWECTTDPELADFLTKEQKIELTETIQKVFAAATCLSNFENELLLQ